MPRESAAKHSMDPLLQKIWDRSKFSARVPIASYVHDEAQPVFSDLLELDGFIEMLMRVSALVFSESSTVADDFEDFIERYIVPHGRQVLEVRAKVLQGLEKASMLIRTKSSVTSEFSQSLKKLFHHYCKQGRKEEQGGQFSSEKKLSVHQFLMYSKECKLSNYGISLSICLDIFVTVNRDEIDLYLLGELPYLHLTGMLQMDFDEFQMALELMVPKITDMKPDVKALSKDLQLKAFIKRMLKNIPATLKIGELDMEQDKNFGLSFGL